MSLVRPLVRNVQAYVPGEQPKIEGLIKLNTNENPYPPSPKVLRAISEGANGRLRLYPNPTAERLRTVLANFHHCKPGNIIVGNGSDELLALATRVFVEPLGRGKPSGVQRNRSVIQYFWPSYSLYPVLADLHGALRRPVPLGSGFGLPCVKELKASRSWNFKAALSFITTPNAPTGRAYPMEGLAEIAHVTAGVVVLDEAYVDFAESDAMPLALNTPNVLVARTFSKGYSLCGLRVGYFVGHEELIEGLQKFRDSYNVNALGQIAAEATIGDLGYYHRNFARVKITRDRVGRQLRDLGFDVIPSQTNFIFVKPPGFSAMEWQRRLRDRRVLVRWFDQPGIDSRLRITIGANHEMAALLKACRYILSKKGK